MPEAVIGLGSNLGDRKDHLRAALAALSEIGEVRRVSSLYETEPVGFAGQGSFLNAVTCVDTGLGAHAILLRLLEVEARYGRVRRERFGPRTLDLDLLFYGQEIVDEPGLHVPHPRLHERRFVLEPLCEIAPSLWHPVLKRTVRQLLADSKDRCAVMPIESYPDWAQAGVY